MFRHLPLSGKALVVCASVICSGVYGGTASAADAATASAAPTPSYTLSANLTVASEYRYRGLMQTDGHPAIQGGFDFVHESGFYLGNWDSNISWLSDTDFNVSAPVEMDFYGGYKGTFPFAKDFSYDAGLLRYQYPGDYPDNYTSPDTTEAYASLGYGPVSFKYSYALTNLFGFADSKNSQYFDLSGNFDTGFWGMMVNAHVGYQDVHGVNSASYTDWKLGLTKNFDKGLSVSLAYIDTNADKTVYTNTKGRYMGRATGLLSVTKTF